MHQIAWFWPPNLQISLPHPPPARSLRSIGLGRSVLKIFSVFFLKSEIIPPPPPPHFWKPVYATGLKQVEVESQKIQHGVEFYAK